MSIRRSSRNVAPLCLAAALSLWPMMSYSQGNLLPDPGFQNIAAAPSEGSWYCRKDNAKTPSPKVAKEGGLVALKPGCALVRELKLPDGVYELTLAAKGKGEIHVAGMDSGRTLPLGDEWHSYSLVFEKKPLYHGSLKIMPADEVSEACVKDAVLKKADDALAKAWEKQEQTFVALGYVPSNLSAQRPAPQVAGGRAVQDLMPVPKEMGQKVIFADKTYDSAGMKNLDNAVKFFADRGFKRMTAEELLTWMKDVTGKNEAYGTVCLLPSGVVPACLLKEGLKFAGKKKTVLRKYMAAGGRVVWMGDATFYYSQDSTGPLTGGGGGGIVDVETSSTIFMGARGNATLTEQGRKWGLETCYAPVRPVNLDSVTISFLGVPAENASQIFLKTLNPRYPLSGLVSFPLWIDGNNVSTLKDIYRLALYLGDKVAVPEVQAPKAVAEDVVLSSGSPRTVYLRGEGVPLKVNATSHPKGNVPRGVEYKLLFGDKELFAKKKAVTLAAGTNEIISETLETKNLACGDYELRVSVAGVTKSFPLHLRQVSDNPFFYGAWAEISGNPYRSDLILEDLKERNMEPVGHSHPESILKHGMRFSGKIEGCGGYPREIPERESPEVLLRNSKGEPVTGIWRPANKMVGLAHPDVRLKRLKSTEEQIASYLAPNLYPWFVTNDDFSPFYKMDWSAYVEKLFKDATGLEAPAGPTCKDSVVPEDDPWFKWYVFSLYDVVGGHDQASRAAKDAVCPSGRIGPVPGGMQMPLWIGAQYPPAQFGARRFDLISYYYYLIYWQPSIGILYWDEVARMNNPSLPLWCTTDCYTVNEGSYHRNNFFLHLAGGVNGLNYYAYVDAKRNAPKGWDELKRTGGLVKSHGKLFYNLKAAPKKVALFLPLAATAYEESYPFLALYAYANLLAAHVDVKPLCREELLAGKAAGYDAVLLYNANKVAAAELAALKAYIANGGEVIVDKFSAVDIPGARRINVDLAMGNLPSQPNKTDYRYNKPGIQDYLIPERVDAVRKALPELAGTPYDADSREVALRSFEAEGVRYLWAVNIHDHEEYGFLNQKQGAGRVSDDPERTEAEVIEFLRKRGVYDKDFSTVLTLPAGGYQVCDLLKGKVLETSGAGDGRRRCAVSMERLGGTLLAFYPCLPGKVELAVPPVARQGEALTVKVALKGDGSVKGLVPVELKVFYPDGKEVPYGKFDIARNGALDFAFIPAVNEPAGQWRVEATELATGLKAAKDIEIGLAAADNALRPSGATVALDNLKGYSILIPARATAQEKFGAAMLAEYLGQMFNAKFPVVQEPAAAAGKVIGVGATARAAAAGVTPDPREQSYKLAVADGDLHILGGTRGPLYGVIALLEEDLGCRWYSSTDKPVVPSRPDGQLTVVPRSYSPPFEVRELLYTPAFNNDWAVFNRLQPVSYFFHINQEKGGGLSNSSYFIHTYDQLVPAAKYFKSHPEYFPLRDGKRHPSKQTDGQLCYTCPGVVDTIAKELDGAIAKNPGTRIYSVSANDNVYSDCECPECQKIIKSADGLPGAQLHLANEVAKRLAAKYPEIKITTLAYVNSQTPTKTILPGPNTVMFYAPIRQRGNGIAMLQPLGDIKEIADELAGWHKIASHIYLWDYVDRAAGIGPFPDFDALDGGWPFLIKNGVTGVFLQGQLQGRTSLAELKVWLYTKKMWNPDWSQDALVKEFLDAYYGPAAAEMAEYFNLQRERWLTWYQNRKPGERLLFSEAEKDRMRQLLAAALGRCGGKPDYQAKVERELVSWYSLMLSGFPTPATAARYGELLKEASALVAKLDVKFLGEGLPSGELLRRWAERLASVTSGKGLPRYSANSITVKRPACPVAKYLPAADGTQGHATRQAGVNSAWGVQWQYDDFIDQLEPGKAYVVRLRAKPEFKGDPARPGVFFGLGYYNFGVGGGVLYNGELAANDNGQYRWVDLFRLQVVTPGMTGYFYSVLGDTLKAQDAVWYDYLELVPEDEFKDKALAAKLPLVKM